MHLADLKILHADINTRISNLREDFSSSCEMTPEMERQLLSIMKTQGEFLKIIDDNPLALGMAMIQRINFYKLNGVCDALRKKQGSTFFMFSLMSKL